MQAAVIELYHYLLNVPAEKKQLSMMNALEIYLPLLLRLHHQL